MFVLVLFFAGTLAVGSPVSGSADVSEIVPCVQNDTCTLYPSGCDGNDKLCCYSGFSMNCFCCFSTTTIGVTVTPSSPAPTTIIKHTSTTIQPTSSTVKVETSAAPQSTESTTKVTFDTTTKAVTVEAPSSVVVPVIYSLSAIICMMLLVLVVLLWREPIWRMRLLYFCCHCLVKQSRHNGSTTDAGFLLRVEQWLSNLSRDMDRMSDHSDDQIEITEVSEPSATRPQLSISSGSDANEILYERFPEVRETRF